MSSLYEHDNYQITLENFEAQVTNGECIYTAWGLFKPIHSDITKDKCPICECLLDNSVKRLSNRGNLIAVKSTIDHYRPQEYYPFLKCDHKNYILMCSECNSMYKKSKFPLYPLGSVRWTEESFIEEQPLIVNPIFDNVLELFDLVFRLSSSGKKVLELKPKKSLLETDYFYEKAVETIKVFGLGDCEENRHQNENVHNCRIELLEKYFDRFYELAKARKVGRAEFLVVLSENPENYHYGFTKFIAKNQFEDLTV